jgi:hypothetical protein
MQKGISSDYPEQTESGSLLIFERSWLAVAQGLYTAQTNVW